MKRTTLILFALLIITHWSRAHAQSDGLPEPAPLLLSDEQDSYPLGLHMEILEDPGGELTISDVTSSEFDSRFTPSQVEVPNFGFTSSAYWLRFQVRNDSPQAERWLLELTYPNMHFVDLFTPSAGSDGFEIKQTGALRPITTRDIIYPTIVFDLMIPDQSQQTYYMRLENGASMTLSLLMWEPAAFLTHALQKNIWHGIFQGIMLGLLGYNLFLFFSLRDVSYLYLVLLLGGIIFYDITQTGLLEVYIAPNLYPFKAQLIVLSISFIFVPLILFNDSFISAKKLLPRIHLINSVFAGAWVILASIVLLLTIFIISYHDLATIMAPTIVVTVVTVAVIMLLAWQRGFQVTRFLLIALAGLLVGILIFMLTRMGLISSNFITENSYRFTIAWMAVCWSIALADRINLLQAETESANRSLQNSEHRLTQTLEALPVGVVVYGLDQKPTFSNQRTADILSNPTQGISLDISARRTLAQAADYFAFRIAGSDDPYPLENMPIQRALQGEPASADDIEADLVDKRVPLEVWASPVRDDKGNIESAVAAFQDITKRKRQETELNDYRKHLERLVKERTDELNVINEQLTHEVSERAGLEELLHKRISWMSKFILAREKIRGSVDLPRAYETLFEVILQIFNTRSVFFLSWDNRDEQVNFLCGQMHVGPSPESRPLWTAFKKGSPLRQELEMRQTLVLSVDETVSRAEIPNCFQESEWRSLLIAPMIKSDLITGVLGVAQPQQKQDIAEAQKELVTKIALDLVTLAQDATYLDQARVLVASEERNRLARDLHDSVTQVLFSASLVAEVLPRIWRRDPEMGAQSLEELRRLTRGALAEMRTMLLELRPTAVAKFSLAELLTQLTEASTSRVGLPFRLFIEQVPKLPEEVHISFYRIAQEALNNVAKHARASQVTLSLSVTPVSQNTTGNTTYKVQLFVEDDGIGFSPQNEQAEHLGMGIMRERAADIKAILTIDSQIREGTRLSLTWRGEAESD